jgi:hypothetical protein
MGWGVGVVDADGPAFAASHLTQYVSVEYKAVSWRFASLEFGNALLHLVGKVGFGEGGGNGGKPGGFRAMMTGVESPAMNLFMLDLHAPIRCCNRLMAASGVRPNGPFLPNNSTRSDVSQTAANAMGGAEGFFAVGRAAVVARPLPPAVAAATSRTANDLSAIDLT